MTELAVEATVCAEGHALVGDRWSQTLDKWLLYPQTLGRWRPFGRRLGEVDERPPPTGAHFVDGGGGGSRRDLRSLLPNPARSIFREYDPCGALFPEWRRRREPS